jgi:hypothetical protein
MKNIYFKLKLKFKMVKLFTIVKNEIDIIEDWVIYHGCLFGWSNIYIIDNFSDDGTFEILQKFKDMIHIYREPDYKKKGEYMTYLINRHCNDGEIAFPLDIDEFIVFYDEHMKTISIDKSLILNHINCLPQYKILKANYIYPITTHESTRATTEYEEGTYCDMKNFAKSFFRKGQYKGVIDHGNHISNEDYVLSKICLVHYHQRNLEQMKKKIKANIEGLGYKNNLEELKKELEKNPNCPGNHHVKNQIRILENNYQLIINKDNVKDISLLPLKNRIIQGYY